MTFLAYGKHILVKPIKDEQKTSGGIILPTEAVKDDVKYSIVVNISEDLLEDWYDKKRSFQIDVGSKIIHRYFAGTPTKLINEDGVEEEYQFLKPEDILGVEVCQKS